MGQITHNPRPRSDRFPAAINFKGLTSQAEATVRLEEQGGVPTQHSANQTAGSTAVPTLVLMESR